MKNILITGATGFVGRHLVIEALAQGFHVIVSARKTSKVEWLKELHIPIVYLSLESPEKLLPELEALLSSYGRIDVVIHNAGLTQSLHKVSYEAVNFTLTKNLVHALGGLSREVSKFIYTSSMAALGPGDAKSLQPLKEHDLPHPVTYYGQSKLKAEQFLMSQTSLPWVIIRPAIVYGPYEKNFFNMIRAIRQGWEVYPGTKNQMLAFIHVKDLAAVFIDFCNNSITHKVYNLSDGGAYHTPLVNHIIKSILKRKTITLVIPLFLVRMMAFGNEIIGRLRSKAPILNVDKVHEIVQINWLCEPAELEKDIDFRPAYDLPAGLLQTINWYKDYGWL